MLVTKLTQYSRATVVHILVSLGGVNVGPSQEAIVEYNFVVTGTPGVPGRRNVSCIVPVIRSAIHDHGHEGIGERLNELGILVRGTLPESDQLESHFGFIYCINLRSEVVCHIIDVQGWWKCKVALFYIRKGHI
jgi:hypothetical protein